MYWRYGAALLVSLASTPALALLGLDSTPPTVTIVKPASGAAISGQAALEVRAEDGLLGSGISRVEYQIDTVDGVWTALSGSLLSTTYRGTWNTPAVADGSHSLACAVIVKRVDAKTRAKTAINELLRGD